MPFTAKDKEIIRELASKYAEVASRDEQKTRRQRMLDTNNLKLVRPTVLIDEIPWNEMNFDGSLTCLCEDSFARNMEIYLRKALYRDRYFPCDTIFEGLYPIRKSFSETDTGLITDENIVVKDKENNIVSHHYKDTLPDEDALEVLREN